MRDAIDLILMTVGFVTVGLTVLALSAFAIGYAIGTSLT
jgi:hypothetical protein